VPKVGVALPGVVVSRIAGPVDQEVQLTLIVK
jgi:hypothetical protein